jgi:CHAT domain-containing protein
MAQVPSRNLIEAHVLRTLALLSQLRERAESKALNRSFQQNLNWLSNQLFASFIPKELPQTLVIVPDGALHRLPFALLHPSLGSGPLGLSHDLIQVPAASVLLIAQPSRPLASFPKTILAVADPVFDASDPRVTAHTVPLPASITEPALPRLPFTADIAAISALQPPSRTVILRGFQASRHNFESYKLDDFAVLHFSTHALIDGQVPELSRIALSLVKKDGSPDQGFLRSDYFAGFHLRGSVVVLSACSTALGKQVEGEGLTGFSTSLLQAGASKVVLTLTDMDAESAAEFFKATYQSYLGHDGVSLEHALTLARNKMAHSARWHDPYYWAPIVLIGGLESK